MSTWWGASITVAALLVAACGGNVASGGGGSGGTAGTSGTGAVGGSGGTAGAASGGTGGAAGGSATQCRTLQSDYAALLATAKDCNPNLNTLLCTQKVNDALMCPCGPTFANPANTDAIAKMSSLQQQWNTLRCSRYFACPAIACPAPEGAYCAPTAPGSGQGTCQDYSAH